MSSGCAPVSSSAFARPCFASRLKTCGDASCPVSVVLSGAAVRQQGEIQQAVGVVVRRAKELAAGNIFINGGNSPLQRISAVLTGSLTAVRGTVVRRARSKRWLRRCRRWPASAPALPARGRRRRLRSSPDPPPFNCCSIWATLSSGSCSSPRRLCACSAWAAAMAFAP